MQQPNLRPGKRFAVRLAALMTIVTVTPGMTTAEQDPKKYRLRDVYAAGDVCEFEASSDINAQVTGTVGGRQELPPIDYFRRQRRKYRETVLAVDHRGRPTAIRRTYSIARRAENDINNQLHQEAAPLQGKTASARLGAGGKVTVNGKNLSAEGRKEMASALETLRALFFPDRPVAVGEEWAARSGQLSHEFEGVDRVAVKGVLREIVAFEGHQCARVEISMEVGGKLVNSPVTAKVKVTGDLYHALDLQRTLSARLIGPVEMTGQVPVKNTILDLRGDGSVETQDSIRWLKVAGKPVTGRSAGAKRK